MTQSLFDIFVSTAPGLELALCAEARECGFKSAKAATGGVALRGSWPDVWRANLKLRGAARITVAIGSFRAEHLSQLDKRSRKFPWHMYLRPDVAFRVEALCRSSKIYHSGAAQERVTRAIAEELGAPSAPDAEICVRVRIERDVVHLALDSSGELLHRRGFKAAVNAAPMRENLAAMFLRLSGFKGHEPVIDPMCGSGTFVIEAAEIAMGLDPGRSRSFAFEKFATFDAPAWARMQAQASPLNPAILFRGSDQDAGAIRMSRDNAQRAGVGACTAFEACDVADLQRPEGACGLVILNPPYGERLGDNSRIARIYRTLGLVLSQRFSGWRVALVTTDANLAKATGLPFKAPGAPVAHGGLRVKLFLTKSLS